MQCWATVWATYRKQQTPQLWMKGKGKGRGRGGGGKLLPIHSLKWNPNNVLTTCKAISKVLPADLCTDHAHYVKIHRSTVLRRNENMVVEGGTVSHDYILVICKFIDFMSLFRHSVWFSFSVTQFPSAEFGICNIHLHTADKNRRKAQ